MSLKAGEILAATSYMVDLVPGCRPMHHWKIALISRQIAGLIDPQIEQDVFYAGLLMDIGRLQSCIEDGGGELTNDPNRDRVLREHSEKGAAMVNWLPGMEAVSGLIYSHEEHYDGSGYPGGLSRNAVSIGGQILRLADEAAMIGCFESVDEFKRNLSIIAPLAGAWWSNDVWSTFLHSTKDNAFYKQFFSSSSIPGLMKDALTQVGTPAGIDDEEGVVRALQFMGSLLDLRDPNMSGHARRVANHTKLLAEHMGISKEEAMDAFKAGIIHDCGRICTPAHILRHTGRLKPEELDVVRGHAKQILEITSCIPGCEELSRLGNIAGHDHERYDGSGYPDGLVGEDIPLLSRVLSVIDAFDSMVAASNHRLVTVKCAIRRIEEEAGRQFDPSVVDALRSAYTAGLLGQYDTFASKKMMAA